SGFKTVETGNMEIVNSKTALFRHEKTGAELLYIQNKDIDRSFNITFKTPAVDNTGVNHILEHITVSGSKKYPLKNVLFTVLNQTYCTFINAFTAQTFTTYPVSSMSEAQLLKFTDMYLDCVYHPSVYEDKNVFQREAWRYEMADEKSPLNITGTVYNEMKGALGNINTSAQLNVLKSLYPNSYQSNVSGGDPQFIKDLSYEQVIKTHQTYYHPSNSMMILYGNLDYEKFLKLINDEYLSKYEKKEIKIDTGKVAPAGEKVTKIFDFPVSASSNTKNASEIDYAYALTDISDMDSLGLQILAAFLNQPTSPLQEAFKKSNIGGSVSVGMIDMSIQPVLVFSALNADEKKSEEFKNVVETVMNDITSRGLDEDAVDAIISAVLLSNSNLTEASNLGINLSLELDKRWSITGKTDYLSSLLQNIKVIKEKAKNAYLEGLVNKYLKTNKHAALVTTVPKAGLAEKLENQHQKYLADLKASMDKEEIAEIVAGTREYSQWNSRSDDEKTVELLKAVNAADLPEEVKKYSIKEAKLTDGIRVLSAEADVGETGTTSIYLDTSGVPVDKLHFLKLYSTLLGGLDTNTYNTKQLNTMNIRYLNGAAFNVATIQQKDKSFTPYLAVSWSGLIGDYDQQINLVKEILLNTRLENKNDILNSIKTQKSNLKARFTGEPLYLLLNRNTAQFDDSINYTTYISDMDYYNFLTGLEKTMTEKADTVISELKAIKAMVVNKTNMIITFAGNKNSAGKYETAIKSLIDAFPAQNIVRQDYSKLPKPAMKEGIVLDTPVQYNMVSATYERMGTTFSGKYIPIEAIIKENYITPKIRFGYGAYDNLVNFNSNGFFAASYRDPNIKETYDVYYGLAEFIKNTKLTQKELERYIVNSYSAFTAPKGELTGASSNIIDYLSGKTVEDRLKTLREIKSLSVEDVKATAELFEKLMKNGSYTTVGSAQKLNDNKTLFDNIVTLDQGQVANEPITRAELFNILLTGVPGPLDTAKQMGLISADSRGNYRENDKLTREELAAVICKVVQLYGKQLGGNEVDIADLETSGKWAREQIKAVVYSGVMKLDSSGNFNPKGEITASEIQDIVKELEAKLSAK
ncbi:MAG: putative Zn-dependent peptidase insulinase, partial [Eubacterium sp.]|nr:putative Zn-dependent peptidase insulinase [Eubacterium sp.]